MDNSCYNCTDRKVGCHSECSKFSDFKDRMQKIKDAKYERAKTKQVTSSLLKSIKNKIKRRK